MILNKRAKEFFELAGRTLDQDGICLLNIDNESEGPLTEETFRGFKREELLPPTVLPAVDCTAWGFWSYENPGCMARSHLCYLSEMAKAGESDCARERARRIYQGLLALFAIGDRLEEGFLVKCYDKKPSKETSIDETGGHTHSWWLYIQHFATEAEKEALGEQAARTAEFFIRHDYQWPYFGQTSGVSRYYHWKSPPPHRSPYLKTIPVFHMAGVYGGRKDLEHFALALLYRGRGIFDLFDDEGNLRAYGQEPANMYQWPQQAQYFLAHEVALDTFDWKGFIVSADAAADLIIGPLKLGPPDQSLLRLAVALKAEQFQPGRVDGATAREILEAVGRQDVTLSTASPDRGSNYPFADQLLSCGTVCRWLENYWRGRNLGLW